MTLTSRLLCRVRHQQFLCSEKYQLKCVKRLSSQYFKVNDELYGLSAEEQELKTTIFNLSQKELAPKAAEIDKNDHFKEFRDFMSALGSVGALGITVNSRYGGSDGTILHQALIAEEVSRASGAIGLSYIAHSNLCVNQIHRNGTEEQKAKYLPKLCSGKHIGALAMSETGSGSDVVSMKLLAEKKGDYFILNGGKFWITNGPDADVLVVYAKTDPAASKSQHGISAFLVEKGMEGFKCAQKLDKVGMRGSNTGELVFEDVKVPASNMLGSKNKGIYVLFSGLDLERVVLAGGSLGIMQAACDSAFDYVHTRKQFGQAIGTFQLMQAKLAEMYTKLSSCRSYLYNVARAVSTGGISSMDCSAAFLLASQNGVEVCLDALQCLGGNGYTNDYPMGRYLRDIKLYDIGGGTAEVRKLVIGRAINAMYK